MKNFFEFVFLMTICVLAVAAGVFIGTLRLIPGLSFGDTGAGLRITTATNTSVGVIGTTSTPVDLPNSSRAYRLFCNTDANNNVYLSFGVLASSSTGVTIFPKTCYTMNGDNNFIGQINGTSASTTATSTISIITAP